MQPARIGEFGVTRIVEYEGPFFPAAEFFPDFDPEVVRAHADLLGPQLIEPQSGRLMFSFHSFIVKTPHHTILIDACLGNDKERPTRPQFHRMRTPYLADLDRAGVKPEDVDFVMCTHLHWDHVGWNTRLQDGSWVPTFPKARYVMAKREFDAWQATHQGGPDTPHRRAFEDSVLPVVKSGQSLLVGDDFALEDGIWFEGAPGHTPGNVVIHARSQGQKGLFMGDVLHHPIQLIKPEWSTFACSDQDRSRQTRMRLVEEHADSGTLVLPAHFPAPTAGHIVRQNGGDRYRYAV
jgi:glyoxylase-like metal-dependent hydrolase (beta-lactamase superfamily II)